MRMYLATARVPGRAAEVVAAGRGLGLHLRLVDEDRVGGSTSEHTNPATVVSELFNIVQPAVA